MANQSPMYELMYIINPVLNDEQTKDIVQRVTAFIRENGGDVQEVVEMGSQRLAYPIQKKRNGYYINANFSHEDGDFIAKFDRALRINDDIMRHLILRYDAKMMRHYAQQKSERANAPAEAEAAA
ncbi:MAG: 30S ribosomal protein S6 [Rhodothermaceae bacterium]|nr:30S ribosomal protein S6 [Rhodothermaceae bacterium]